MVQSMTRVPSFSDRQKSAQASLFATVARTRNEIALSMAIKLQKLNKASKKTGDPSTYRFFQPNENAEPECHLYKNDVFVRILSPSAVDRRLKDTAVLTRKPQAPLAEQLTRDDVRKRRAAMRETLLNTLTLTTKIKNQIALLKAPHSHVPSPFVVE